MPKNPIFLSQYRQIYIMNTALTFDRTLRGSSQSKVDPAYWDTVLKLYEEGKYHDAVVGIIRYVNPELLEKTGNKDQTRFVIPHGSIVVQIDIEDNHLYVKAPFLSTADAMKIPLLRQVAQINFSPLNLAKIFLEDDKLVFNYHCPLDLCEPYKMYEVFREICIYADSYDDEFIKKFGAKWLQEPVIKRFPKSEADLAWDKIQHYLKEGLEYIEHFEDKRNFAFCWDIIMITLMKIEYYAEPQGLYRNELEKMAGVLQGNIGITEKISRGKEFFRKLQDYSREDFDADIYEAQSFIPYKYRSTIENIRSNFEETYASARKERDGGDHIGATLSMQHIFLKLFFYNNVEDNISRPITEAMIKSSNKPWPEASAALWKAMEQIMSGKLDAHDGRKKRGFFRSLFGK